MVFLSECEPPGAGRAEALTGANVDNYRGRPIIHGILANQKRWARPPVDASSGAFQEAWIVLIDRRRPSGPANPVEQRNDP